MKKLILFTALASCSLTLLADVTEHDLETLKNKFQYARDLVALNPDPDVPTSFGAAPGIRTAAAAKTFLKSIYSPAAKKSTPAASPAFGAAPAFAASPFGGSAPQPERSPEDQTLHDQKRIRAAEAIITLERVTDEYNTALREYFNNK